MHEVDEELRDIKREIIESRGLVIKTNNLTNALSADIKSIAKRQQSYERRLSFNSATTYVVFVVVVFAALKLAWDARVDQIRAETEQRGADNERLRKELRDAQKRDEDRARAEARAAQFYDLIRQGKRAELVEQHKLIAAEPLSKAEQAFFSDAVERARNELATQLYQQGMDKARVQRWQEAANAFEESQRYKKDSAIAPSVLNKKWGSSCARSASSCDCSATRARSSARASARTTPRSSSTSRPSPQPPTTKSATNRNAAFGSPT